MKQQNSVALIFTAALAVVAIFATPPQLSAQYERACSSATWEALKTLAGDYSLMSAGPANEEVGAAEVALVAGGCGVTLSYTIGDQQVFTAASIDPIDGRWHESVLTSTGSRATLAGTPSLTGGELESLNLTGTVRQTSGAENAVEASYQRDATGHLQHTVRVQIDGNWVDAFDLVLVSPSSATRVTDVEPSSEAVERTTRDREPAPSSGSSAPSTRAAASPSPSSSAAAPTQSATVAEAAETVPNAPGIRVKAPDRSARVSGNTRVTKIAVESPMSVELALGPLHQIPKGYGWRTSELAQYEIGRGTIETIEVKKSNKRKRTTLTVTFFGQSQAYTQEFELTAQILSPSGAALTETVTQKLFTGRAVGAQATNGVSKMSMDLQTDSAAFEAAFKDDQRPVLNLTVVSLD